MLRSVLLDGFRSFAAPTTLPFAPLTILAGPNNVGKSSVIGALLAFLQSEQAQSGDALLLSGAWCDLGGFDQVLCASLPADRRRFSIGFTGETSTGVSVDTLWSFGPPADQALASAPILDVEYSIGGASGQAVRGLQNGFEWTQEIGESQRQVTRLARVSFAHPGAAKGQLPPSFTLPDFMMSHALLLSPMAAAHAHYISAFRAPPQALYAPRSSVVGPPLGRYGEHTAELLFRNRTQRTDILVPGAAGDGSPQPVLPSVNAWWSYIFDGSLALQIDAPARLGFTLAIDTPSAERLGLGQVGLGLSQALPIVSSCLVSRPGDLILVETPEAHLHPGAQHRLTSLFVELARRGRQVVVETHSEHIVNAVRLAVKSGFSPEDISIVFFQQEEGSTVVQMVELDPRGRALRWPPGFFDQAAADLTELLR
jgi:predicted ATPase